MAHAYAVSGLRATAGDSSLCLTGSATATFSIYYVSHMTTAGTTDAHITDMMFATTADGTATANPTPAPLWVDDIPSRITAGEDYSAEPTVAGEALLVVAHNQRSHYQFYCREGGEFVSAKATGDGFAMQNQTVASGSPTWTTVFHWTE